MKKNSEIHEGLDQQEVRNFLAHQMAEAWNTHPRPISTGNPSDDILDKAISSAKDARDLAERQVKNLEHKKAVVILVQAMGWQEFDVSEMTIKDGAWWWSFIGTEEEYKETFNIESHEENS